MRLNQTIAQLDNVMNALGLDDYIIQSYTALDVPSVGIVSDVTVIFPGGRDYTSACLTHLAAFMPVYEFIEYHERFNSVTNPVALGGIEFHFTWVDSAGS